MRRYVRIIARRLRHRIDPVLRFWWRQKMENERLEAMRWTAYHEHQIQAMSIMPTLRMGEIAANSIDDNARHRSINDAMRRDMDRIRRYPFK